jgi:hypothetical protein
MRLTITFAVALLFGCSNPTYYQGLGRPAYDPVNHPTRLPVSIVEVYVTDADPAKRFALLVNEGTTPINAGTLTLKGPAGSVPVGDISAGGALQVFLSTFTGAGPLLGDELAAVDAGGTVHAYTAWSVDPSARGSSNAGAAYLSGATTPGDFVPTGLPPPSGLAFVSLASGVGCAPPSETVAGLAAPTPCPITAGAVAVRQVVPAVAGADSVVTLANTTAGAVNLHGLRLCQGASCAVVTSDVVVAAGGGQVLHVGTPATATTDPVIPGVAFGGASELAVLASGSGLTSIGAPTLQAYVLWGAIPARFDLAATAAGLWPAPGASGQPLAAEAVRVPGEILVPVADAALAAPAWAPVANEPDAASLPIGPTADLWTTCSAPRRWGPQPRPTVVMSAIEAADSAHGVRLHFTNRDVSTGPAVPLSAIAINITDDLQDPPANTALTLDTVEFVSGAITELAPGSEPLVVELAASCPVTSKKACLQGPTPTSPGELALFVSGTMVQYLASDTTPNQVGVQPLPKRALITQALAANLWPGARGTAHDRDCAVTLPADGGTLNLDLALDGRSPPDWQ